MDFFKITYKGMWLGGVAIIRDLHMTPAAAAESNLADGDIIDFGIVARRSRFSDLNAQGKFRVVITP